METGSYFARSFSLCWPSGQEPRELVISSPAIFSLSPHPGIGHVPATKNSWWIESSRALVGLRRQDQWPKYTPPLGRVLVRGLGKCPHKLCRGPWFCDFCSCLSLLMTDPGWATMSWEPEPRGFGTYGRTVSGLAHTIVSSFYLP